MKRSFLCSIMLSGLLAACHSPVTELDKTAPSANDFTSALAAEYQGYSDAQAQLGRRDAANYYASKGINALHGEKVVPDTISAQVNSEDRENLAVARELLLSLLTNDLEHVNPQKTAHAQLLFDCWQDKASSPTAQGRTTESLCDEEFAATIAELQTVADTFHEGEATSETVHFAHHDAVLNHDEEQLLTRLAGRAISLPATTRYTIELDGHIEQYLEPDGPLGQARLEAVRHALIDAGVPSERIIRKTGGEKAVVLSSDDTSDAERGDVDITLRSLPQDHTS